MPEDDLKELSDWKDILAGRSKEKVEELSFDLVVVGGGMSCLLYTSPSPRDATLSRMPSSA